MDAQQPSIPTTKPAASDAARPTLKTLRITTPPTIDGRLDDEIWAQAPAADHFRQRDPNEGQPATERTEIRLLYDDNALYVGARMFDTQPAAISKRLTGRDQWPDSDSITLYLDPRHDHRTGVQFTVSAAGVQGDGVLSNDNFRDDSWDAVWSSQVSHDDTGWSAELRIPFSQLRFKEAAQQTWGINVSRFIHRKNETVWLEFWPKNDSGMASRMMHLAGLDGVHPRRRLEIAPYLAARQEFVDAPDGDPFNDGSRTFGSIGVDLKASIKGGLVLDATINPDFGQAEVDPAVVNLSAYETFYPEKRRFFIEGSEIFNNFGRGGSNNFFGFNTSTPDLFYSRRIGRSPSVSASGDFVDTPRATTILGAAKLTGKTGNNWSVGIIEAVTAREHATHVTGLLRDSTLVEPATNYFVGRVQREFTRGGVGFLTTSVLRDLDTPLLTRELANRAFVFGGDAYYFLDSKKDWVLTGEVSASHVAGSATVIEQLQRAPQRYYQRPDATHLEVDPQRTSLRGYEGRVFLNRNSGVWRVNAAVWGVNPGYESNDLGFHSRGDRAGAHGVLLWRKQTPDRFTPLSRMVARQSVDLELRPRHAERLLDGMRRRDAEELLVGERLRRILASRPARRPHTRRTTGGESAQHVRQWRLQHRQPQMDFRRRLWRPRREQARRVQQQRRSVRDPEAAVVAVDFHRPGSQPLEEPDPIPPDGSGSRRRPYVRQPLRLRDDRPETADAADARQLDPESPNVAAGLHAAAARDRPLRRLQGAGHAAHVRLLSIRHAGVIPHVRSTRPLLHRRPG